MRNQPGASSSKQANNFFDEQSEDEGSEDDFQFGIWLRHRRIDGALNRVPPDFYAVSLYELRREKQSF